MTTTVDEVSAANDDVTSRWLPLYTTSKTRHLSWLVSVVGGLLLAVLVSFNGSGIPNAGVAAGVALALALPTIAWIDAHTTLIPNKVLYPAYAAAVASALLWTLIDGTWGQLATAALFGLVGFALYFITWFLAPAGGFGFGDVRFAGLIGFALGFHGPLVVATGVLALPVLVALASFTIASAVKRESADNALAFGPAMAAGAAVCLLFPEFVSRLAAGFLGV